MKKAPLILLVFLYTVNVYSQIKLNRLKHCTSSTSTDGSIDIGVIGGGIAIYSWNTGDTTEDLTNLAPGTYIVHAITEYLCTLQLKFEIKECGMIDSINYNAVDFSYVTSGDPSQSSGSITITPTLGSGIYYYSWSNSSAELLGYNELTGLNTGTYCVTVSDGCSEKSDCIELSLNANSSGTRISQNTQKNGVNQYSIFPTSFENSIYLVSEIQKPYNSVVNIRNLTGSIIFSYSVNFVKGNYGIEIPTSSINQTGFYYLEVNNSRKTEFRAKLLKK